MKKLTVTLEDPERGRRRMTEPQQLNDTFTFTVNGHPENQEDLNTIVWAFKEALWQNGREANFRASADFIDQLIAQNWQLPYDQGGGHVTITKSTKEELEEGTENDPNADEVSLGWEEHKEFYTGWTFFTNYADSFTSPFFSPIYKDDEYYLEEM